MPNIKKKKKFPSLKANIEFVLEVFDKAYRNIEGWNESWEGKKNVRWIEYPVHLHSGRKSEQYWFW